MTPASSIQWSYQTIFDSDRGRSRENLPALMKLATYCGKNLDFRNMKGLIPARSLFTPVLVATILGLANSSPGADDRKNILGIWLGGMPGDPPGSIELRITPGRISGRNPRTGESLGEGTYKLDPVNKTIDPHRVENFGRGKTYLGRYSLAGDTLKWVSNSRGNKRPADLVHRPERDQFLMMLERQR